MHRDFIPTPALVIDDRQVEKNLTKLADYGKQHQISIRPHTKTHKSLEMARRQMEAGAVGLTVAKAGEAEIMAPAAGELLVAYPALDPIRRETLAKLAREHSLIIGVDSIYAVQVLAKSAKEAGVNFGILIEVDTGFHRTGVQTGEEATLLAREVDRLEGLRLEGLMFFPGNIKEPPEKQGPVLEKIDDFIGGILEMWKKDGLEARIISGGSTPTAYQSHRMKNLTEIRPGTYLYNDMNTALVGSCTIRECAAWVVTTVISRAVPGQAVIDAGSKTLTSDRAATGHEQNGFGRVIEYPRARIIRLSEEHGVLDISKCEDPPELGRRIHVIPNHICPCVNLQDHCWIIRKDGKVEQLKVDARGKLN